MHKRSIFLVVALLLGGTSGAVADTLLIESMQQAAGLEHGGEIGEDLLRETHPGVYSGSYNIYISHRHYPFYI